MTDSEIIKECRRKGLQNGSVLGFHSGFMDIVADRFEELMSENERLKAVNDSFTDIGKLYSELKAEAYKEFAEMFKKKLSQKYTTSLWKVYCEEIDNLLEELIGE